MRRVVGRVRGAAGAAVGGGGGGGRVDGAAAGARRWRRKVQAGHLTAAAVNIEQGGACKREERRRRAATAALHAALRRARLALEVVVNGILKLLGGLGDARQGGLHGGWGAELLPVCRENGGDSTELVLPSRQQLRARRRRWGRAVGWIDVSTRRSDRRRGNARGRSGARREKGAESTGRRISASGARHGGLGCCLNAVLDRECLPITQSGQPAGGTRRGERRRGSPRKAFQN